MDFCDFVEDVFLSELTHVSPQDVRRAVAAGMDRIKHAYGGGPVYVRKVDKTARNAAIRKEFNGRNMKMLCERYQLSKRRIYQIVNEKRAA